MLLKNVRYALRSLRKHPGFTAIALVTLALGIGANTAIFSLVRAVLLAPLPYPDPGRLVQVWPEKPVSVEQALAFDGADASFDAIAPYGSSRLSLTGQGRPEQLLGTQVGHRFFGALGVTPTLGRAFRRDEQRPGAQPVAIISHRLWQTRFGGSVDTIGRELRLGGTSRTVIGVMPEQHRSLVPATDVWLPISEDPASDLYRDWAVFRLLGRLSPEASIDGAQQEARQVVAGLHRLMPNYVGEDAQASATVTPLLDHVVGDVRTTLWLLFGAVVLVLIVACTNVANLMLARSAARGRELALRSALGAGRGQLFLQVMIESLVLALAGGLLGTLAAAWVVSILAGHLASSLPRLGEVSLDGTVLAFSIVASVLAGLAFGLAPALRATGRDLLSSLRRGGRGHSGQGQALHGALVGAEIAVSMVLVIGAGLLVKSFLRVQQVELGFRPDRVFTVVVQPDGEVFGDGAKRSALFERIAADLAALPGVQSAGGINQLPLTPGDIKMPVVAKDRPASADEPAPWTSVRIVTDEWMETLGVSLVSGRGLSTQDRAQTPAVGLVNQTLARRLWGETNPIGRELVHEDGSAFFTVVGLVADMRHSKLDQVAVPQIYLPSSQQTWASEMAFALRSVAGHGTNGAGAIDGKALTAAVEQVVWSQDPQATLTATRTLDDIVAGSLLEKRQLVSLFSIFAALALVLGAVGVYGVTAYLVSRRVRETAIRMALGATGQAVVRGSVARLAAPVLAGLVVGWAAAFGLARLLSGLLYEVEPSDPAIFFAVALFLATVAVLASYLPARRAARVDPAHVLTAE